MHRKEVSEHRMEELHGQLEDNPQGSVIQVIILET